MKYKQLNYVKNQDIILFFNGWGMDESVINHLTFGNYDVLMFYDYNTLDTEFDFSSLNQYVNKYLVAWSMGVMCATLFDIEYTKKIAINGTLKPIDNNFGIPEKIYDLTIKNFSPESAEKFIKSMSNDENHFFKISRGTENIRNELQALKKYSANLMFEYDKVYISEYDKIIPTKNQVKFWNISPNLKSGHAPFMLFTSWEEII